MGKKIINVKAETDQILIPVAWLKYLIELAEDYKSFDKQHFVGYIESGRWLLDTCKRESAPKQ